MSKQPRVYKSGSLDQAELLLKQARSGAFRAGAFFGILPNGDVKAVYFMSNDEDLAAIGRAMLEASDRAKASQRPIIIKG